MALTKVTGQVIKNTTDVTVGVLTVTNTLAVGGTVSIGGTLTYEDVTNVDSVGLITARNGIVVGSGITLSKDGDVFATGIVTATTFSGTFSGDGTSVTGVAATENIRTNTNATFLQNINVSGLTTTGIISAFTNTDGTTDLLTLHADADGTNNGVASIKFTGNTGNHSAYIKGGHTTNGDTILTFHTDDYASGFNPEERLRIKSDGNVEIGSGTHSRRLSVHDTTNSVILIEGASNGTSNLMFGDENDEDVGMLGYNHGSNYLAFTVNAAERLRIDSSGRLFLGLTTLSYPKKLNVQGESGSVLLLRNHDTTSYAANTNTSIEFALNTGNTGNQNGSCEIRAFKENGTNGNNARALSFYTAGNGGSPAERVRMASDGAVRFGTTAAIQSEKYTFFRAEADQNTLAYFHQGASSDVTGVIFRHGRALSGFNGKQIGFLRNDGNEVGSIVSGSSSTGYNTSSDYRLKENVTAISDGITRLKTLKPYKFNFKDEPSVTVDGFFAHEVTAVPEAITGTKDQVDADNNPVYQQIDQSKLVPLLTAALQEAVAKIEVLESEVAALKSS